DLARVLAMENGMHELEEGELALARHQEVDRRAVAQRIFRQRRRMLATSDDDQVRMTRADLVDELAMRDPLLREHHRNAEHDRVRIDALDQLVRVQALEII